MSARCQSVIAGLAPDHRPQVHSIKLYALSQFTSHMLLLPTLRSPTRAGRLAAASSSPSSAWLSSISIAPAAQVWAPGSASSWNDHASVWQTQESKAAMARQVAIHNIAQPCTGTLPAMMTLLQAPAQLEPGPGIACACSRAPTEPLRPRCTCTRHSLADRQAMQCYAATCTGPCLSAQHAPRASGRARA